MNVYHLSFCRFFNQSTASLIQQKALIILQKSPLVHTNGLLINCFGLKPFRHSKVQTADLTSSLEQLDSLNDPRSYKQATQSEKFQQLITYRLVVSFSCNFFLTCHMRLWLTKIMHHSSPHPFIC
jgi:hypothetical protein